MRTDPPIICQWTDRKWVEGRATDTKCERLAAAEVKTPLVMGALAIVHLCVQHNGKFNDVNANLRLGRAARR